MRGVRGALDETLDDTAEYEPGGQRITKPLHCHRVKDYLKIALLLASPTGREPFTIPDTA